MPKGTIIQCKNWEHGSELAVDLTRIKASFILRGNAGGVTIELLSELEPLMWKKMRGAAG